MKKIFLVSAVAAILLCCCLSLQAQRKEERAYLTVLVCDSLTRQPLDLATVVLKEGYRSLLTNAKGFAFFDSVRPGIYTLVVFYTGYHKVEFAIDLNQNRQISVPLCPEVHHLHVLDVKETAPESKAGVAGQSVITLSKRELDALKGQTLGDMLKHLPGINVISTGPSISKPVIRGLHSQRIVMLNAGVKQEGQQWGGEHGPEIDPFMPGKVQVVRGASSVAYGPEAIGGVIRIEPRDFKVTEGVGGEWQLNGFSNNRQGASSLVFDGHHHAGKSHFSWWTQASARQAGDSKTPHYIMSNTGFKETDAAVGVEWRKGNAKVQAYYSFFSTRLGILRGSHTSSKNDLLNAIASDIPFYTKPFTYSISKPRQEVSHHLATVRWVQQWKQAGELNVQVSSQFNNRREYDAHYIYSDSIRALQLPGYELHLYTQSADVFFEHKSWKRWKGKVGANYMHQGNVASGERFLIPNFIAQTIGFYLIEKWQITRLYVEGGIRYDLRLLDVFERTTKEVTATHKNWDNVTGVVGVSYFLNQRFVLTANLASAWRPPSVNELYSNGLHGGTATYELGNKNLKAEKAWNADCGVKYQHNKWLAEVNLYRNVVDNFIYLQPDTGITVTIRGSFPTWKYTQANVLLTGAEAQVTFMPNQQWTIMANGSYLYAQNNTQKQPLILMPANRINLVLRCTPFYNKTRAQKLFIEGSLQLVARQNRYTPGTDYTPPPAGYQLTQITLGNTFTVGKQAMNISLSVGNLFNVSYRDYLSRFRYFTNEPGRNFILRVSVPFLINKPQIKK